MSGALPYRLAYMSLPCVTTPTAHHRQFAGSYYLACSVSPERWRVVVQPQLEIWIGQSRGRRSYVRINGSSAAGVWILPPWQGISQLLFAQRAPVGIHCPSPWTRSSRATVTQRRSPCARIGIVLDSGTSVTELIALPPHLPLDASPVQANPAPAQGPRW